MMQLHDLDIRHLKDIRGYKPILKAVLRNQIQLLVEQLAEHTGEESVLLTASLSEGTMCHLGSKRGKKFLEGRDELKSQFLDHCLQGDDDGKNGGNFGASPSPKKKKEDLPSGKKRGRPRKSIKLDEPVPKKKVVRVTLKKHLEGTTNKEVAGMIEKMIAKKISTEKESNRSRRASRRSLRSGVSPGGPSKTGSPLKSTEDGSTEESKTVPHMLRSGRAVSKKFMEGLASLRGKAHGEKSSEKKSDTEEVSESENVADEDGSDVGEDNSVYEQMGDLAKPILEQIEQIELANSQLEDREVQVIFADNDDTGSPTVKLELEEIDMKVTRDDNDADTTDDNMHDYYNNDEPEISDEDDVSMVEMKSLSLIPGKRNPNPRRKDVKDPTWSQNLKARPRNRYTDKIPQKCDMCGVTIIGKNNLWSHKKRVHFNQKDYICKICGHAFWSAHDRESHTLSVHTRQCHECNTYVTESEPWAEGTKRTTIREVVCVCGAEVQIMSTFGRKRIYFNKEKKERVLNDTKYACGTCGKLFLKRTNCERHQKSHSDVKSHVCHMCGNAYSYENSLSKHLRSEHGVAANVCDICGKTCASTISLNIHIAKHHAIKKTEPEATISSILENQELVEHAEQIEDAEETETKVIIHVEDMPVVSEEME